MNHINFYDASALLKLGKKAYRRKFVTSTEVIRQLELNKSIKAKKAIKLLKENKDKYDLVISKFEVELLRRGYQEIVDCYWYDKNIRPDETVYVTNSWALANQANIFFGTECIKLI